MHKAFNKHISINTLLLLCTALALYPFDRLVNKIQVVLNIEKKRQRDALIRRRGGGGASLCLFLSYTLSTRWRRHTFSAVRRISNENKINPHVCNSGLNNIHNLSWLFRIFNYLSPDLKITVTSTLYLFIDSLYKLSTEVYLGCYKHGF